MQNECVFLCFNKTKYEKVICLLTDSSAQRLTGLKKQLYEKVFFIYDHSITDLLMQRK